MIKPWYLLALIPAALLAAEPPVTQFRSAAEQMDYYRVPYPLSEYPPELVAAGRTEPDFREAAGFEQLAGWTLKTAGGEAELRKTAASRVYGSYAAEIVLLEQKKCQFELIPSQPIPIRDDESGALLWGRLLQYRYAGGPVYQLGLTISDAKGRKHRLSFPSMALQFQMWGINLMRLPEASAKLPRPWKLEAITGSITPREIILPPYYILLDSLQFFQDDLDYPGEEPLLPAPQPTTAETIRPPLTAPVENAVESRGRTVTFTSRRGGETIRYIVTPKQGDFGDLTVEVNGERFQPFAGGGPVFELEKELLRPGDDLLTVSLKKAELKDGVCQTVFQARSAVGGDGYTDELADYRIDYSLAGRTLLIEVSSTSGKVAEVNFGTAEVDGGKLVTVPYLRIDPNGPKVLIGKDFYLSALADPWVSEATRLFGNADAVNGGVRYEKLTDGTRNPARERIMLSVSGEFAEVLPNLPNPASPYIEKYAAASWRWGMTQYDWPPALYHQGVRDFQFRSHADLHRDINESYGFRAAAAPSKGEGFIRGLRDRLVERGFGYGPYNCYLDQNPFVPEFSPRNLRRNSNGQFSGYHPTPAYSQRLQEKYAPEYIRLYSPTFSYLDVHGCREPWRNPDMRAGSHLAGRFRGEFLGHAAIMLRNRELFNGPCFTEGGCNWLYAGFYDVIYGYSGHGVNFADLDDIVDFDLLRIKPLAIQAGMGDWNMYFRGKADPKDDRNLRRFVTATLIYGHAAMLESDKARVYFLTNAIQRNYLGVPVTGISYSDGEKLRPSSEALHTGALGKGFIRVEYANGLVIHANLNKQGEAWTVDNRTIPAPGFHASYPAGGVEGFSLAYDWVRSPEYLYIHTRGETPAARDGIKIGSGGAAFRSEEESKFLLFPQPEFRDLEFEPAKLGLPAAASYRVKRFDPQGKELGEQPLESRTGVIRLAKSETGVSTYEFITSGEEK